MSQNVCCYSTDFGVYLVEHISVSFDNFLEFTVVSSEVYIVLKKTVHERKMSSTSTANTQSPESGSSEGAQGGGPSPNENGTFECNICLDTARDAVVSMCGHLFCWPCLHQWLETRPNRQVCPVCKAGISKEKVVPLYGRGTNNQEDPREKVPPRPAGQRSEPENNSNFPGFGLGGDNGLHFSFGIGAFPFTFFASSLNFNDGRPPPPAPGTPQSTEEQFLSKIFLWVAVLFIFWLMIA